MAIFGSFGHSLSSEHFTYMATRQLSGDTTINDLGHISRSLDCFTSNFSKNSVWYGKSYYRLLIGNHTLAFDWCHFWWPWSTFEPRLSFPRPFQQSLACFRVARSPSNSWASCWFRPPDAQNVLSKICNCTKSPISRLVWQIDRRCLGLLGGFRFSGMADSTEPCKMLCGRPLLSWQQHLA